MKNYIPLLFAVFVFGCSKKETYYESVDLEGFGITATTQDGEQVEGKELNRLLKPQKLVPHDENLEKIGFGSVGDYLRLSSFASTVEYEPIPEEKWIKIKNEALLIETGPAETWFWKEEMRTIKLIDEEPHVSKPGFNK